MFSCPTGTFSYSVKSGDSLWLIAQRFHTTIHAIADLNPMLNENRLYIGQVLCIPQEYMPEQMPNQFPQCIGMQEQKLSNQLRLLWEQHVYWTRMAILSIMFGLPDVQYTSDRLLRNPKDFEAVLKLFYGEAPAAQFAELLTDHLKIAADLFNAAKAGNTAAEADAERRWYSNADQIAAFLSSANPYWSEQEWQRMLYDHLAMTKTEALDILNQQYEDSIAVFDMIEQEALAMADAMTQGLVKQFPGYFA